jgi:hypothetical protein
MFSRADTKSIALAFPYKGRLLNRAAYRARAAEMATQGETQKKQESFGRLCVAARKPIC